MATITGTAGNDLITPAGVSAGVIGGVSSAADDDVFGDAGDDSIAAGGGNDSLAGGTGSDTLDGGAGADTLAGDGGDVLQGSVGEDTYLLYVAVTRSSRRPAPTSSPARSVMTRSPVGRGTIRCSEPEMLRWTSRR